LATNKFAYRFESFEESSYLNHNPDVAAAILRGEFSSGWHHYIAFGCCEGRPGVPPGADQAMQDILVRNSAEAVPPAHLRKRVHGDEALDGFERIGWRVAYDILSATRAERVSDSPRRILDFGCGCGRVLRFYSKMTGPAEFYGSDIDPEAIAWCNAQLSHLAKFVVNPPEPPLPFEDGFFDFLFLISVFTHLPEEMEHAWLSELRRVTKPGGLVLLTSHGEHLLAPHLSEEALTQFQAAGFHYHVGAGTDGLPSFYQTSYHTDEYLRNRWGGFFEIEALIKKGIANHQDLILCRKRLE
jgi:SAM-dependent methyltransferase